MAAEFHVRHLLMELDIAAESQQIMAANVRMIQADLQSVKSIMEELRASWQGDAAMMYFTQFDNLFSALSEFVRRWGEISDTFANEIPAWEEMGSRLAGSS